MPSTFSPPTSGWPLVRHWVLDPARAPTSPDPSSIPSPLKTPHTAGGHRLSRMLLQPSLLTLVPRPALGREAGSVQGPRDGCGGTRASPGTRIQLWGGPCLSRDTRALCGALWGDFALKGGFQEEEAETPGVEREHSQDLPLSLGAWSPGCDFRGSCLAQGHPGRRQWPLSSNS